MAVSDSLKRLNRSSYSHPWMAKIVFALDRRLQQHYGVVEYSRHPACMFRIELCRSRRSLVLRDGTQLRVGERIARLHYWNEHMPTASGAGATIGWGREFGRRIALSLAELQRYFALRPDLTDVAAVCADVSSGVAQQSEQVARIMTRFGFETIPPPERLPLHRRLHRFGENMLISLMVIARNTGALRLDTLRRARVSIYLSRRTLEERFGAARQPAATVAEQS